MTLLLHARASGDNQAFAEVVNLEIITPVRMFALSQC